MRPTNRFHPFAITFFLLTLGCMPVFSQKTNYVTENVIVDGLVDHAFTITLDNLNSLPVQEIKEPLNITNASGEIKKEIGQFKGILLSAILDSAAVQMPHKKARGEYIVQITASDGYKVIFAWNELYYGPAGENTWLIFEQDGQPIADEGKFIIHCSSDQVTGPRHVKWVEKIEVKRI